MSHCPSCGRYVGPHEACPYCSAHLTGRTSIRTVKIVAIFLATVGLAALWFAAVHVEIPIIQIGQAGATMNMAYVRLAGRCTRTPTYDPESDYLSFWIEDETGEIRISAYRAETRQIIAENRVPALGDQVEVAGTLRVREDFLSLTLNVPEQLKVIRAEPEDRVVASITPTDQYLRVRVQGKVDATYEPYEGLTIITLQDESGSIPIAVSEDLIALNGSPPPILPKGQSIEVVASVSLYGDTPQLIPASVSDILLLDQPVRTFAEKQIEELTAENVGQRVIVRGAVADVHDFSAGVKFTLRDDDGDEITVLLWQDVYDELDKANKPEIGAEMQAQGEISQYRGELEIVTELAEDVKTLSSADSFPETTPTEEVSQSSEVEGRPIGEVTSADVGETLRLAGTLGEMETFSAGVKFPLSDSSGAMILLLWQDVYDSIPNVDQLTAGAQVEVTGEIEEYQGDLEIIPETGGVEIRD